MNRLKELRKQRRLKQFMLATMAGINPTYVSLIETGSKNPTDEEKEKIARALNVKPAEIWPN